MDIKEYNFQDKYTIRTILDSNTIWFVAKDVAFALEYSDTQAMTRRLDVDELNSYTDTMSGQGRKITIINESGLYSAILGSKKPEAKQFKRWVTNEVLPSIRKTGNYSISQQPQTQNLQIPDFHALTNELNDYEIYSNKLLGFIENLRNRNQIDLFRFDKIMNEQFGKSPLQTFKIDLNSQFFLPTELGKMINKSPVEINLMLAHKGFQLRENGVWTLTKSGRDFGIEIVGNYHQIKWKMKSIM